MSCRQYAKKQVLGVLKAGEAGAQVRESYCRREISELTCVG